MFGEALMYVLTPMSWAFDLFARLLSLAHALPVYLAIFFIGTVSRLIIRRWVGDAVGDAIAKSNPLKRKNKDKTKNVKTREE